MVCAKKTPALHKMKHFKPFQWSNGKGKGVQLTFIY